MSHGNIFNRLIRNFESLKLNIVLKVQEWIPEMNSGKAATLLL